MYSACLRAFHTEGESCSDVSRVFVRNDPGAWPTLGACPLSHCGDPWYTGYLDHVRVWTARLPAATVLQWHARVVGALHPFASHLAASWLMDQTQGRVVQVDTMYANTDSPTNLRNLVETGSHFHMANSTSLPVLIPERIARTKAYVWASHLRPIPT